MRQTTSREKILSNTDRSGSCWLWRRSILASGYGQVRHNGKPSRAHRVAYEVFIGPIPAGLVLDHLCGVKSCCNPEHLEPVTQAENLRRGNTWQMRRRDAA